MDVNAKGYYTFDEAIEGFGGKIPSKEQWEELIEECKWTWVKGKNAEKTGYKVTGPNGKSIFLPAVGYSDDTDVMGVGTVGYYWSSTFYLGNYAFRMYFSGGSSDILYGGRSVRLVKN